MKKIPFHIQLVRGAIGKRFVVKHYGKRVVVTKYPVMAGIRPSAAQRRCRRSFAAAVLYAKRVLKDTAEREKLARKVKRGQRIYHAAIREYLRMTAETEKRLGKDRSLELKPVQNVGISYRCVGLSIAKMSFSIPRGCIVYCDTG